MKRSPLKLEFLRFPNQTKDEFFLEVLIKNLIYCINILGGFSWS